MASMVRIRWWQVASLAIWCATIDCGSSGGRPSCPAASFGCSVPPDGAQLVSAEFTGTFLGPISGALTLYCRGFPGALAWDGGSSFEFHQILSTNGTLSTRDGGGELSDGGWTLSSFGCSWRWGPKWCLEEGEIRLTGLPFASASPQDGGTEIRYEVVGSAASHLAGATLRRIQLVCGTLTPLVVDGSQPADARVVFFVPYVDSALRLERPADQLVE